MFLITSFGCRHEHVIWLNSYTDGTNGIQMVNQKEEQF